MKMRVKLILMIGVALSVLWGLVAVWMQIDLDRQVKETLDQRLRMSAEMVGNMIKENPSGWQRSVPHREPFITPLDESHMVCHVQSVHGEIYPRSRMPGQQVGFSDAVIAGTPWRVYTLEANGMLITTADRVDERNALRRKVMLVAIAPFAVALVGGLIVLWLGVGHGLLPLERLRQLLARRAPDELTPVPEQGMPADLKPFVSTLNELMERIGQAFSRERRFTADAAHELRTPLTAIKLHLQVLRLSKGEDAEQALSSAEEGVARLQHTLTQLLMLAQVEGQVDFDDGDCAFAGQVARLAINDSAATGTMPVSLSGDALETRLAVPQGLAVTALRNLLDNAQKYGRAPIELQAFNDGDTVRFIVTDHGVGLSEEQMAQATERFWRRSPSGTGSGLGLSIVEAIAVRFGGSLELASRDGGGLQVTLTLPARVVSETAGNQTDSHQ
jgi:signal transduction histidine kinase